MYIISPAQEVIQYTLPNSGTNQSTPYYAARYGGLTQTMESLKGMAHPAVWPNVKTHITTSLAIVKNLSDFAQELSQMYEHHAGELQLLVGNYRKKNAELRKEGTRGSTGMLHLWEALLAEVEADSQAHGEIASVLGRQVSRHTLERTFHRKVEARKLLAHRESLDSVIAKSEDTLSKCRQDYKAAYLSHVQTPGSTASLAAYLDAHNTYVTQLHSTNAMVDTYCRETLPELLTELEDVYADLATTLSEAIAQGAEIISNRAGTQSRRYCTIWNESKEMDPSGDASVLIRNTPIPAQPHPTHRLRLFTPPQTDDTQEAVIPQLKNTLVTDRPASLLISQGYESLNTEQKDLTQQIQQLQDALNNMLRIQQRSIESSLFNKANEIQEDISVKRYELKTAQINLAAVKAKKELFAVKMETADGGSGGPDRKMSSASTSSMKNKWLKAFKSLKTPPPNGKESDKDKRNGKDLALASGDSAHQFQEYTYKKITPCDVCSQVLRGHTRQGLKCRLCKMNVHIDCQERVGKCQTKSRLLRRQKSSSDIDGRPNPGEEEGFIRGNRPGRSVSPGGTSYYGGGTSPGGGGVSPVGGGASPGGSTSPDPNRTPALSRSVTFREPATGGQNSSDQAPPSRVDEPAYSSSRGPERGERCPERGDRCPERGDRCPERGARRPNPSSSSHHHHPHQPASSGALYSPCDGWVGPSVKTAPHSPRRQKLNLRMKSLSLDSPESTEHSQRRRPGAGVGPHSGQGSSHASSHSSSSRLQSPSSPVHSRRLLSARNMRMSSVELPDDNEKSISSASTSPCPSPKPHRLLPTNLYVVLYNFKARHADELDLKAGYKLTVIDTSDPDWWRGKCLGRVGYFPSKYVAKVQPGERALQVTHNLQVADTTLLRDQIVIQIGEEVDGMVMIRSGDNRQGVCPVKYLTEV